MEGGSFSKCGSRRNAEHIRSNSLQPLHGWRAGRFQTMGLALAPAHSSYRFPAASRRRAAGVQSHVPLA
eukprot:3538110-Pyramimonas_sp.AAC.1